MKDLKFYDGITVTEADKEILLNLIEIGTQRDGDICSERLNGMAYHVHKVKEGFYEVGIMKDFKTLLQTDAYLIEKEKPNKGIKKILLIVLTALFAVFFTYVGIRMWNESINFADFFTSIMLNAILFAGFTSGAYLGLID